MSRVGRDYDITVYGATGFTGKRICHEIVESGFTGSFALAGRSETKLEALKAELDVDCGIIVADVDNATSLVLMAQATKVLINTVGPFRYYGEPVVKACIQGGCDYLDVRGEPEFIERIELDYDQSAKDKGIFMASAVGFDSVPGDLSIQWTLQMFNPPARCTLIETFISIQGGSSGFRGHYPTYLSAIEGFASANQLSSLRKRASQLRGGPIKLNVPGPKPRRQTGLEWDDRVKAYTFPFMGADASVVRRTMAGNQNEGRPAAHVAIYLTIATRLYSYIFLACGSVFIFLAQRTWGQNILKSYPGLFSFGAFTYEGPTEQQMNETVFSMTNIASGYSQGAPSTSESGSGGSEVSSKPDMTIITRLTGPEPGYIACSIFIVAAARTLLEERNGLGVGPGVHTPGRLLQNSTGFMEKLKKRGIRFERVDSARIY